MNGSEEDWAQRIAALLNEAQGQGFPIIGITIQDGDICVDSYGGGVHYDTARLRRIGDNWQVLPQTETP